MTWSHLDDVWLAGFFDGEGCISILPVNEKSPTAGRRYAVRLYLVQKNEPLLREIQKVYGGHIYVNGTNSLGSSHRLQIQAIAETRRFLEAVAPFLRVKKELAYEALELLIQQKGTKP